MKFNRQEKSQCYINIYTVKLWFMLDLACRLHLLKKDQQMRMALIFCTMINSLLLLLIVWHDQLLEEREDVRVNYTQLIFLPWAFQLPEFDNWKAMKYSIFMHWKYLPLG